MTQGTIIAAWKDALCAHLAVRVEGDGATEYIGSALLLKPDGTAKSNSELKTECVNAVKEQRKPVVNQSLPLSGEVSV